MAELFQERAAQEERGQRKSAATAGCDLAAKGLGFRCKGSTVQYNWSHIGLHNKTPA